MDINKNIIKLFTTFLIPWCISDLNGTDGYGNYFLKK